MLKLLSYNIHFGRNLDAIGDWIARLNPRPEILCLQEYPEDKIHKQNPLSKLGYEFEYAPGFEYKGSTFGELTAYRSTMTLSTKKIHYLGTSSIEKYLWCAKQGRTGLYTHFIHKKKNIFICNLHLACIATNKSRRKQIDVIIDALGKKSPVLIAGDYNYSNIIKGQGLIRHFQKKGFTRVGEALNTHTILGIEHQLDYIFEKNCIIKSIQVENITLSDHKPLLLTFSV